jgi:hypothetical protein
MEKMMEIKPVQNVKQPSYPTRREVLAGAASFALFHLAGCSFVFAETEGGKTTVAPIFKHGEGRGATGCIVVSPPVFLSEEEGMQILREELAKHGIQLKAGGELKGVRVPGRDIKYDIIKKKDGTEDWQNKIVESTDSPKPLILDGLDSEKRIAVEFISDKDYYDLGGPLGLSSVHRFDFIEVVEYVAEKAKKQGKDRVFLGLFYDPMTYIPRAKKSKEGEKVDREAERKERKKKIKEESEKQLRLQAQDFVAWLKEQKAIQ